MTHSLHQHQFLSEALQWRAQTDPDHVLYVLVNAKVHTCTQPHSHSISQELSVFKLTWQRNILTQITIFFVLLFIYGTYGDPFCWLYFQLYFLSFCCRGCQCAQPRVLSCTKELRKSQLPSWKGVASIQETMWCCFIHQVNTCSIILGSHIS